MLPELLLELPESELSEPLPELSAPELPELLLELELDELPPKMLSPESFVRTALSEVLTEKTVAEIERVTVSARTKINPFL